MSVFSEPDDPHYFFGAYFHQDWMEEAGSYRAVVALYKKQNPNRAAHERLAARIEDFFTSRPGDDILDSALHSELGCEYDPKPGGKTVRQWLQELVKLLRETR